MFLSTENKLKTQKKINEIEIKKILCTFTIEKTKKGK